LLLNLDKYYSAKNTEVKQKIIGSIFPEKLFFQDNEYRTTKLNKAVELLCKTDKGLGKKKGGKNSDFSESSLRVELAGVEPASKRGIAEPSTCLASFWFSESAWQKCGPGTILSSLSHPGYEAIQDYLGICGASSGRSRE